MGEKGSRMGEDAPEAADRLVTDLAPLGDVRSKAMFGGFGIFCEDIMFSLVDSTGRTFLRISPDIEDSLGERHGRMPYGEIPDGVRADPDAVVAIAGLSLEAARRAKG